MNKKYKLKITSDLVKKFSQDSNDYNPIHISPKYASRSLYGEVICHGSLILYLILKKILTKKLYITSLKCTFFKPVYINDILKIHIKNIKNKKIITAVNSITTVLRLEIEQKKVLTSANKKKFSFSNKVDKKINILNIKKISHILKKKKKLVPFFKKKKITFLDINENIIVLIFNISRIIGMKYPGKNSLFLNCDISYSNTNPMKNYFSLSKFDKKTKILTSKYNFGNYSAQSKSLLLENVKKILTTQKKLPTKYYGKRAIIIGGSRGLGFLTTQILLNSGINVVATYFNNLDYLNQLKKKYINELNIKKLNILNNKSFDRFLHKHSNYDYIFNFSSCKIKKTYKIIDKVYLDKLLLYYLTPLKVILKKFKVFKKPIKIFNPSTIYLNDKNSLFKEYNISKKQSENFCKRANFLSKIKFFSYRLNTFDTDQHYAIYDKKIKNNFKEYLSILENFLK